MHPRLKINFIPYANTPESLVLLSKIAQFRVFFSLTTVLYHLSNKNHTRKSIPKKVCTKNTNLALSPL